MPFSISFDGRDQNDHTAWARYHRAVAAHQRVCGNLGAWAAHEGIAADYDRKAARAAKRAAKGGAK